ncbi:SlyX family protein [Marinimicrobium sp. ARAG 43.8]|uniref:SlyX family protein n=1 Tax=Marinimicrobium sp. ARAG 43.8 TaxID=3418719 RepID=UPI003CED6337
MTNDHAIEDLQSRLAFQEQTLMELNAVVASQALHIDRLEQQIRALAGTYRDLRNEMDSPPAAPASEKPPHY